VDYTIEFIGTAKGTDPAFETIEPAADAKVKTPGRKYSADVGKVLASVRGTSATYRLTGNELYVRAAVRSNKPRANPGGDDAIQQQAWCQPVGWEN
jgi:hypothetical protein